MPHKNIFLAHFPSKHNSDHYPGDTSGTAFPDLIVLITLEAHNNI